MVHCFWLKILCTFLVSFFYESLKTLLFWVLALFWGPFYPFVGQEMCRGWGWLGLPAMALRSFITDSRFRISRLSSSVLWELWNKKYLLTRFLNLNKNQVFIKYDVWLLFSSEATLSTLMSVRPSVCTSGLGGIVIFSAPI